MLTTKIRTVIIALAASASLAGMTAVPAVSQALPGGPGPELKVERSEPEHINLDCIYGDVAYPLGTKLTVGHEVLTCVAGLPPHWAHEAREITLVPVLPDLF